MADISTVNLDSGTDSPASARAQILAAVQRLNYMYRAQPINVWEWGVAGNGSTNDTAAILAAQASDPFGALVFPPGNFLVNAGTFLFQGSIHGASNYATKFTAASGTTGIVMRVKSSSGQYSAHVHDFLIDCQGANQRGIVLEGSYGTAERIKVWHSTGTGFQLGNAAASSGCFWWTVDAVQTLCFALSGVSAGTGLLIDSSPGGANANTLTNFYTAGFFTTGWDIKGIGNSINGTVEFRAGCVDVINISGTNNTLPPSYAIESVSGALPSGKLFNVSGNFNTAHNQHLQAALDKSLDYYISDTGHGNEIHVAKSLRFVSQVKQSLKNYFPGPRFDYFPAATQAYGFGAAAGVSQDLATLYEGNPSMKMTLAASASNASCVLLTGGSGVTNYPLEAFAGKTISFSAACKTTLAGYGGMTYTIAATSGTINGTTQCSHSGSGDWEVFADSIRIPDDATQLTITLKSHPSGTTGTGSVWFANPTLVFGREAAPTSDALRSVNDIVTSKWQSYSTPPTIEGMTTPGVAAYSRQIARYKEVDGLVYFYIVLVWTSFPTAAVGTLQIANGLPFTSANIDAFASPPLSVYYNNLAGGAGKQLTATAVNNSRLVSLWVCDQAGGAVANMPLDNAGEIRVSGFYEKA